MTRTDVINKIAKKIKAKTYLEIGVRDGENFKNIKCDFKLGVDPDTSSEALVKETSDFFFSFNKTKFDLILIDGLHTKEQVLKDIINSLTFLDEGGWIICHDMNPIEEIQQTEEYNGGQWTGTCWKAFVELRMTRADLSMYVVDTDYGCGLITKGTQKLLSLNEPITYKILEMKRNEILNLITIAEFQSLIDSIKPIK